MEMKKSNISVYCKNNRCENEKFKLIQGRLSERNLGVFGRLINLNIIEEIK